MTPNLPITDLTETYLEHGLDRGDTAAYEAAFPELFDHYFRLWVERDKYPENLTPQSVRDAAARIKGTLPEIARRFEQHQLSLNRIETCLLVGQGGTNGHAFRHDDRWVVWLPVETCPTDLQASVFVTHEMAHALHYRDATEFYFDDLPGRHHFGRQLLTEGLATLATAEILAVDHLTALWADFVPEPWARGWHYTRLQALPALARYTLDNWDSTQPNPPFFCYTGEDNTDPLTNRSGYLLGLELMRCLRDKLRLSLPALLRLDRSSMEREARRWLEYQARQQ